MQPRRRTTGGTDSDDAVFACALQDPKALVVRCAWCGRYSLGSEWMEEGDLPQIPGLDEKLHSDQITHSICPDCVSVRD
jgi:hypothetical protein